MCWWTIIYPAGKHHVEHVLSKISKRMVCFQSLEILLPNIPYFNIYNSLIVPYSSYSLIAWGQTSKTNWNAILIPQKRALRFIHFSYRKEHAIPLFVENKILPINIMYFERVLTLMHDVSNKTAAIHIEEQKQGENFKSQHVSKMADNKNNFILKTRSWLKRHA